MAVTDFATKVAVIVRNDLATWQRLNVTAFLISGITAHAGSTAIGEHYLDADGRAYLPLLVQPVLVFAADRSKLHTVLERAQRRDIPLALYTADMFRRETTPTTAPRCGPSRPLGSTSSDSPYEHHTATRTRCCGD